MIDRYDFNGLTLTDKLNFWFVHQAVMNCKDMHCPDGRFFRGEVYMPHPKIFPTYTKNVFRRHFGARGK
jgi:hypothetical protein